MGKIAFILLLLGYSTSVVCGQDVGEREPEPVQEEYQLEEIVVTAFNVSRRLLDMPGSLTMISPEQISRERAATVVPLLNQASGVFAHSGTLSTSRITIRGIGARVPYATGKIRAYFNNIPLTNGSGISILEQIDPSVIERIEIIKGPATSAYGAGLGGTINITSRQPFLKPAGVSNSLQVGSYGLLNNSIMVDMGSKNLASSLVYNRSQSDGFRENSKYRRDAFTSVTQFRPGERTQGTLLFYLSDMKGYIPSSIDSITFMDNPRAAASNWFKTRGFNKTTALLAGISGAHQFTGGFAMEVSIFSTIHDEMERRPFDFLYEDRRSAGTRLKGTWVFFSGLTQWQIMAGGELFFEDFNYKNYENTDAAGKQGEIISRNDEKIRYNNIFVQADMDMEKLNLSAGLNANTNRINYTNQIHIGGIDRSGTYNYGVILSPRISANYRYHPVHAVFATISHGFSPPSLSETLSTDGFINPDILPEKSWNFETGLRGSFMSHRVFYDLGVYRMHVRNLLVAERVGEDAWVGRNAGSSVHQGVELELQGTLFAASGRKHSFGQLQRILLRSALSINHYRFSEFVDNEVDHSGNAIPGVPPVYWNADVRIELSGGLYASIGLAYAAGMPMNDANSRYSDSYVVAGATAGFQRQFSRWNLDLFLKADNLFDAHYASMILINAPAFGNAPPRYYYPAYPRNFTIGLRIGLQRLGNNFEPAQ
jgi:iron complex outermembrane recepter protein